jgi:hypothetical protein
MITDRLPRSQKLLDAFRKSDRMTSIALPEDGRLVPLAKRIEEAMLSEERAVVRRACQNFLATAADFYGVPRPTVRVLASRPLRVYESGWSTELFGDYDPGSNVTRVWMRTAVRKQVTSFGTFMSTLCHEFCHQLDFQLYNFPDSPHTRGFYERAALLYHDARGTPKKQLFWRKLPHDRFQIDWVRMRKEV